MNKQNQIRVILISILILSCTGIGIWGAVPQSTVRTTGGGITTYVGNYMNATVEYYRGTQNYTAWILAKAATGAGGWPVFDQDLNTTNTVTFANVNATWEYYRGGANYTQWLLAKADAATTTFDQSLDTTDHVSFASVNATGEFYRGGVNYTATIEGLIAASGGESTTYSDTFTVLWDGTLFTSSYSNGTVLSQNADAYTVLSATMTAATADGSGTASYWQANRVIDRASVNLGDGEFDIGNNILLIPNHVTLKGSSPSSTIISGNHTTAVIMPMWSNYTFDFGIEDLYIKGLSGTTDYPLNIDCNGVPSSYPAGEDVYYAWHWLDNIHVSDYQTYSIRLITDGSGGFTLSYWNQVRVTGTIYMNRMFDSMFHNIYCYGLILDSVTSNHFDDWYVGGANSPNVRLYGDSANNPNRDNVFSNFRSDNPVSNALSVEGYSCYNQFVNCQFTNRDADSSTAAYAVQFIGFANHNEITGSYFGASTTNVTKAVKKFIGAVSFGADTSDNKVLNNNYDVRSFTEAIIFSNGFIAGNLVDDRLYSDPKDLPDICYWGELIEGVAGENLDQGEICFLESSGKYWLSDSNATSTMFVVVMAAEDILADAAGVFLVEGYMRLDTWTWTPGSESPLYAGWTPGSMSQVVPDGLNSCVQIVGYPVSDVVVRFDPDWTMVILAGA